MRGTSMPRATADGTPPLAFQQLAQNIGQDATMPIIRYFLGCFNPGDDREHDFCAVVVFRVHRQRFSRRHAVGAQPSITRRASRVAGRCRFAAVEKVLQAVSARSYTLPVQPSRWLRTQGYLPSSPSSAARPPGVRVPTRPRRVGRSCAGPRAGISRIFTTPSPRD
jgi:hypothetical protein